MPIVRRTLTFASLMLVTFALLMAANALVRQTTYVSPLAKTMRALGVGRYAVRTVPQTGRAVTVHLANGVDLEVTVENIEARLTPILGHPPVVDATGPAQARLRGPLETLSLPAEEAAAIGNFVAMDQTVQDEARTLGVKARMEVDNTAVYLTVMGRTGDAYLVIPRTVSVGSHAPGAEVIP